MTPARAARRDTLAALLLAAVLGLAWTARDWNALSALRLPDTDDAVRLQQVRDWLHGQGFADVAQHRLGLGLGLGRGLEMHWSRLADLLAAALILAATPLLGAPAATILAVVLAPLLLFAAALVLVASIARALRVDGATAAIVAALGYPATTLFVPGRIDHHGLQMVLLLVLVRAAVATGAEWRWGLAGGLASAAALAVGIETAPLLAIGAAAIALGWVIDGTAARPRLAGYAAGLSAGLLLAAGALRTGGWTYPACDGFTREMWRGAQVAAAVPLLLALLDRPLATARRRAAAAAAAALAAGVVAALVSPDCLRPYGRVDPLLARVWLAQVAEAQPLLQASAADAIGYAGVLLAGLLAAAILAWRRRRAPWWTMVALLATALALTLVQLRGAYAGALLAAPALAAAIAAARRRGAAPTAAAWLLSAGLAYALAGRLVERSGAPSSAATGCDAASARAAAGLPPGVLIAPVDVGARALLDTPHRVLAAPYHRNGAGNLLALRVFHAPAARAPDLTALPAPVYVLWCGTPRAALGSAVAPGSLAAALARGAPPSWLVPVARGDAAVYRLDRLAADRHNRLRTRPVRP
ncbi:hypothetical protein [Sphingomonas corticis]|uniref:Glycosyltransferase RgtA/B/C/D-like domain-containing protein n=1 Tax=Sphingomonas corticis TaxID=2722791 RepID=A0ABX1CIG8_9SPHN|nr:hypothetical protein [Sphingomonas corticis]